METASGLERGWKMVTELLKGGFVIFLLLGAWQDMRRRKIKIYLLIGAGAGAAVLRTVQLFLGGRVLWGQMEHCRFWKIMGISAGNLAAGAIIGAGLLLLSKITEGAIGKGDGWFFVISGLYLGGAANFLLLAGGLMLCFLYSGVIMFQSIIQGEDMGKQRIPFLPFLVPIGLGLLFL